MENDLSSLIHQYSQVLSPVPTEAERVLSPVPDIRAVVFDVYGTLMISGCGDISLSEKSEKNVLMREALVEAGFQLADEQVEISEKFYRAIAETHADLKRFGTDYPEVDIREVWSDVLMELFAEDALVGTWDAADLARLCMIYELKVNATWLMPQAEALLETLRSRGYLLGIVSNAQFFTPILMETYWGKSLTEIGFEERACVWSYVERVGKPSVHLYKKLARSLAEADGVAPEQILFVGNDMLNDVTAAQAAGLRTALFAGDQRSLRWREDKEQCAGVQADAVVTELNDLLELLAD